MTLAPLPSTIQGTVSGNNNPLQGATVTLTNQSGAVVAQTTTNGSGSYVFSPITPGSYTVAVVESSFQSAVQGVITQPGQIATINFSLNPNPGFISGIIRDASTSSPLPGAAVSLLTVQGDFLDSVVTDGAGNFVFAGVAPGQYEIRASAANFATNVATVQVSSNQTTSSDIPLAPNPGRLTGVLTDRNSGTGITGATVQLINKLGAVKDVAVTDGAGQYVFESVIPSSYNLVFTAPGYSTQTTGAIIGPNETTTVNLQLVRTAGSIEGTVLDSGSSRIAGAQITVLQNNIPVATTITDRNGQFLIDNLAPGDYVVVASAENTATRSQAAVVQEAQTTSVTLLLAPNAGTLAGQVTDVVGNPIVGATISIQLNTGTGVVIASTFTEVDGSYVVTGLAPGSYTVNIAAPTYQTTVTGAQITSGETTIVNTSLLSTPGAVNGQMTDALTGSLLEGARIEVRLANSGGSIIATATSDASGQFLINQLAPGSYTLVVFLDNYQTTSVSVTIVSGETSTANIALDPSPGGIQGVVTNSQDGSPLSGAAVNVVDRNGTLITTALTDQEGSFHIGGLKPDSYTLTIFAKDFQNGRIGTFVRPNATTPVTVSLAPQPGQINGTVLPAVAGTLVRLQDTSGSFIDSVITAPNGSFQFVNLAPGNYTVSATATGFGTTNAGVTVRANQSENVALTLIPNPGSVSGTIQSATFQPLSNVLIQLVDSAGTIIGSTFTNAAGQFIVVDIPAGSYSLLASASGFVPSFIGILLNPGEDLTGVNLVLASNPGAVNGQITNAQTGTPIAGATVVVRDSVTQIILATATTTGFGNYTVSDLPPGPVTITISETGFGSATIGAIIKSNETTTADLALTPNPGAVSGILLDPQGNRVRGNDIQVQLFNENNILVKSVLASSDGTYTINDILPGNYFISVTAPGYSTSTEAVNVTSNTVTNISNQLIPDPVTLIVTVVNSTNQAPISGAKVSVRYPNGTIIQTQITDLVGQSSFVDLPAGNLVVTSDANDFGTASIGVFAERGEVLVTSLSLTPNPGNLNGFVTNLVNGDPIASATIQLIDFTNTIVQTVVSDSFGQFTFAGVSPGNYTVIANAAAFGQQSAGAVISSGVTSTLGFALSPNPGLIEGTVVNLVTGAPLQGATVTVRELSSSGPIVFTAVTDQNGFYQTTTLAPLVYVLVASDPTSSTVNTSVQVTSGSTQRVNFQLSPNPGGVQGTVVDAVTQIPLASTLIRVLDHQGGVFGTVQTDQDGRYVITGFSPGTYTIPAVNLDYQAQVKNVEIVPNTIQTVNYELVPFPATLEGTVTDALSDIPLVGAIIQIFEEGTNVLLRRVLTNEVGFFRAEGLPTGAVRVLVSYDQYANAVSNVVLGPNQTETLRVNLNPFPAMIIGRVLGGLTFDPIKSATVQLVIPNTEIVVASIVTEPDGTYVLPNLPTGSYNAIISADNFQTETVAVILSPGETEIINVTLNPNPATVTGNVSRSGTGAPIPNVLIQAFTFEGVFLGSAFTDSSGTYTLMGLPAGPVSLSVSAEGFSTLTTQVTLTAGALVAVNFSLSANLATLIGRVTEAGSNLPIEGASVQVFIVGTVIPVKTYLTETDGQFFINGLEEGEYRVVVSKDSFSSAIFRLVLAANEVRSLDVILTPNPATIRGQVTNAATGFPIEQAGVISVIQESGIIVATAQTNSEGQYILTGIAPGNYNIIYSATNFVTATIPVILLPGEEEELNVALVGNPASITGTVRVTGSGTPLPNVLIQVFDIDGVLFGTTLTDVNGQYSFTGLDEGTYSILASAEGYATETQILTILTGEGRTANFFLTANPASLTGTVLDETTGLPIPNAFVQSFLVGSTVPVQSTFTDPEGRYVLSRLPEGEFRLEFSKGNYQSAVFRIILDSGEARVLDVQLARSPATLQGQVRDSVIGQPLARANVVISIQGSGIIVASTLTDLEGRYVITGLAPGDYSVSFQADSYVTEIRSVTLASTQILTLNASLLSNPATVTGTVVKVTDGLAIEGALVRIFNEAGEFVALTLSDENGRYTLSGLNTGTYTVRVVAFGFQSSIQSVTLIRGTTTELNFRLGENPASISGRVTAAATNQPIEGALVQLFVEGTDIPIRSTLTLPDGTYRIIGLPPGRYRLVVRADNYLPAERQIMLSAGQTILLDITLIEESPGPVPVLSTHCIRVEKLYDWVQFRTNGTMPLYLPIHGCLADGVQTISQEALLSGEKATWTCDMVSAPAYEITQIENGVPGVVTIEWFVPLVIRLQHPSNGDHMAEFSAVWSAKSEIIICIPAPLDEQNVTVKIREVHCTERVPQSGEKVQVKVTICADVAVTAEVFMEVAGELCAPRSILPIEKFMW